MTSDQPVFWWVSEVKVYLRRCQGLWKSGFLELESTVRTAAAAAAELFGIPCQAHVANPSQRAWHCFRRFWLIRRLFGLLAADALPLTSILGRESHRSCLRMCCCGGPHPAPRTPLVICFDLLRTGLLAVTSHNAAVMSLFDGRAGVTE